MDLSVEHVATVNDEQRARVLGAFFCFGGVLGSLTLLVGAWPGVDQNRLSLLNVLTGLAGAAMFVGARFVPRWACHAAVASGSVVIALCHESAGGGAASASYQLYFVWSSLYVFIFYGGAVRIVHTAFAGLCLLVSLVALGEVEQAPASLVITFGSSWGGGFIVGHLMDKVRALAGTDPLTGVRNRRAAEQVMAEALARSRRSGRPLALALLDLDGFKQLNDAAGHATGDRVLREAADRWGGQLRQTDTLARLGGDEFLVVLEDCPDAEARTLARRLISVTPDRVGCSAGVAIWDGFEAADDLLKRCDASLYRAKAEGGGHIVLSTARSPAHVTTAASPS